jgi:hypothetical protein
LMSYGCWNGGLYGNPRSGCSPAFLDAYCRVFLGYVSPINITDDRLAEIIPPVEDSAKVYRLWTHGYRLSEYFLAENRSPVFTDTALGYYGLTIYHIDVTMYGNAYQWWPGMPSENHYMVALEQADNHYDLEKNRNAVDGGDPYPGNTANLAFTSTTTPSSNNYYGTSSQVSISNITYSMSIVSADFSVGGPGPACDYIPGDINGDNQRLGGDVTYGVRYFKGIGGQPIDSCFLDSIVNYLYVAADVNGNCEFRGSDITRLVAYFKGTAPLSYCHFFPTTP